MSAEPVEPYDNELDELPDDWKFWRPEAKNKLLAMLQMGVVAKWTPFYCRNIRCNGQPHVWPVDDRECPWRYGHEWERDEDSNEVVLHNRAAKCIHCGVKGALLDEWVFPHARVDQRPPYWAGEWDELFIRSGRGSGKTKTGAEITNQVSNKVPRITLIGATGPDIRAIMVEGESGILACADPGNRPTWEPSKKQLTWPNGCIALGYSAEEPDRLRGQNAGYVWADEPAHWPLVAECWENMEYGLRKGRHPKVIGTSTPKSTKWVKKRIVEPYTIDRRVSSMANLTNLSPMFRRKLEAKIGTRMGRQEIEGEIFNDVEGALWKWDYIHEIAFEDVPDMVTVVVAVDPAGSRAKRADETGIIVMGKDADGVVYVLADYTGKYSPELWARRAVQAVLRWQADRIVYEKNYGGEMVTSTLENEFEARKRRGSFIEPRLKAVDSRRGKEIRAEPIVAKYEKRRVYHVGERQTFEKLEDELTTWIPGVSASPNRLDAMVHGATDLFGGGGTWELALPL